MRLICLIALALLDGYLLTACAALQFQFLSFSKENTNNITIISQDWYSSATAFFSNSSLCLTAFKNPSFNGATTSDRGNLGRVVFKHPIAHLQTSGFATSFTFQIITTRAFPNCGSGMAFFIADSLQAPTNSIDKGALGLLDPSLSSTPSPYSFFAVEFDTHVSPNFGDPSASHIGIDVNSMISLKVADTSPSSTSSLYPDLFLYNNSTFTVWIEYDASTHLIHVWMSMNQSVANSSGAHSSLPAVRPAYPCLEVQYDLSAVFAQKAMYIGFSAASSPAIQGMEGHIIHSWTFTNEPNPESLAPATPHRRLKVYIALASTSAVILAMFVVTVGVFLNRRRNQRKHPDSGRIENVLQTARPFSYKELMKATGGFDEKNKVGEGGNGSVYKGTLSDGSIVAVKKLKQSLRLEAHFCAEASIIRKVRHRYLLELQGWCYEDGQGALLVSQYLSKGSLDGCLFNSSKKELLGKTAMAQTETRIRILTQVAAALEYLHRGLGQCVLHRDVKPANVLLTDDKEVEARLCDFGLARLISHKTGAVAMTAAGTPGYVAPELWYRGLATDKADVFSFGVLALEMACGRRAISKDQEQHICDRLWSTLSIQNGTFSDEQLRQVLDPIVVINLDEPECNSTSMILQEWRCVMHVGLICCHPAAECRPCMKEVTRALDTKLLLPLPKVNPRSLLEEFFGVSVLASSEAPWLRSAPR